jgi:hypothetical protein
MSTSQTRRKIVETVHEALSLLRRQAELEQSMKEAGGIRITEEQVGGLTSGSLPGLLPPYHQPPGAKKPIAAAISYLGEPAKIQELTSPGTFAYTVIERPTWWPD